RPGRLRLGRARVHGRLRRLDGLVRLVRGRCDLEYLPGGALGCRVDQARLVRAARLYRRLLRNALALGLEADVLSLTRKAGRDAPALASSERPMARYVRSRRGSPRPETRRSGRTGRRAQSRDP